MTGMPTGETLRFIHENNVKLVVSATHMDPPIAIGIPTLRVPFEDHYQKLPDMGLIQFAGDLAIKVLDEGKSVLVHCAYGLNRSALIVAYVLTHSYGLSGKEAVALIRRERPGTLHNPVFAKYVEEHW